MNHNHFVDAPGDLQLYSHALFADDGEYLIEADNDADAAIKAGQLCSLFDLKAPERNEHKACLADMRLDAIYARLEADNG